MPAITRRTFLATAAALPYGLKAFAAAAQNTIVYFGTDTNAQGRGIYEAAWNSATRKLTVPVLANNTPRPSYLAKHGKFIYAVNAIDGDAAAVTAYKRQRNGALVQLNKITANGNGPAYIAVHPSGRAAYVANYFGGSISTYAIAADGRLSGPVFHLQYTGHGPNAVRQPVPHPHSTMVSPDGRFLLVNDLGLDQIHIYRIDPTNPAQLTPNDPPNWQGTPGSGPRHIAFAPNGHYAYSINEMAATIDLLHWDAKAGVLTTVGEPVSTLAGDFKGANTACEIIISSDGRFLYACDRGEDSITAFTISPQDQKLTFLQRISCGGKTPRHITFSPDGASLLSANQDSANVAIFARNRATGVLTATQNSIDIPNPMFILFA